MKLEPGCAIRDSDLSDRDFGEIDLAGAVLTGCLFRDVQFSGTCLQDARFEGCTLIRCRFANADLRDALFRNCSFKDDAGHVGPRFAFSRMDQVRFDGCDLSFAKFDRSALFGIALEACNLRGAVFHKAEFGRAFGRKLVKSAVKMRRCNLEYADLAEAAMPQGDLTGSILREAVLVDADLEGADLRDCDLVRAATAGAKLARADLRGADLAGLNLKDLASIEGMIVSADQQHDLLAAMGLDVYPE